MSGFDAALNYKSPSFRNDLAAATPDFVNVYWDNVGGEILDKVLERAALHSRFVMCGAISGYNTSKSQMAGVKNLVHVIKQRVTMQGLLVLDYYPEFAEARKDLGRWLEEGKLKCRDTVVKGGLKEIDQAVSMLYAGANIGKMLLEVKAP